MDSSQTQLNDTQSAAVHTLADEIKGIRIAMLTTLEDDGTLRARPMATQEMQFDGDLWFFTHASTPKVSDVEQYRQVSLSYANPDDNRYVSVSGTAQIVRDDQKMRDLWKPFLKAWFPQGLEDPDLALLQVHVSEAEYWDAASNALVRLASVAKALVTGQEDQGTTNEKLDLH